MKPSPRNPPARPAQGCPDRSAADFGMLFAAGDWATKFPPILTVGQAAELLQVPKKTVYDWNSRGLLKSCSKRVGKHLRILRDQFIELAFQKGITHEK